MSDSQRYSARGVSATKDEVHQAIRSLDKGLYPNAFCKILPDVGANDPDFCTILHADTAGTKASLAYVYWRETGDLSVWKGIAQDAIVMNLDDMGCVGCVDHFLISNTITRNKHQIPGEVLSAVINGTIEFCDRMRDLGITIHHAGGETADVGDIVRTIDVGFTAFGRLPRNEVLVNDIREGDVIVGLSPAGRASYEDTYNSGMGSNGLTSARHDVLDKSYAKRYPESYDPATADTYVYSGSRRVDDTVTVDGEEHTVGKLLLSPTRTFLPVLRDILAGNREHIHGLIHCTGGGQTKVSKFLPAHLMAVKDTLPAIPPVFSIIRKESGATWKEMYQVFNMGVRIEVYVPSQYAGAIIDIAHQYNIEASVIGTVQPRTDATVEVHASGEVLRY